MGLILAGVIALILFGTLYPFGFDCPASLDLALRRFDPLTHAIGRGDLAGNLVLFIPLGLAASAWARRLSGPGRFALALLLGGVLSFGIELAQSCTARTSSWTDVALNVASTAIGASLWLVMRRVLTRLQLDSARADVAALLLLGMFLVWQLAPFVPTIDWQKWRNALKPLLLQPEISAAMVVNYAIVWLIVARLAVAAVNPARPLRLWLLLLAAEFGLELVIVGKTIRLGELLGAIIGVALASALIPRATRWRDMLLALLLAGYTIDQGLQPYRLAPGIAPFHWLPFAGYLGGSMFVAVQALGQKMFCYGGLVWILWRAGFGLSKPAIGVALLVLGIEIAQMRLPGRFAEITDPLLVLLAAGLFQQVERLTLPAGRGQHLASRPAGLVAGRRRSRAMP